MSDDQQRPWLAVPGRDQRFGLALLSAAFLALWLVAFVGADRVSRYVPWAIHIDLPIERHFPFVPELVWLYLSLDLVLPLAPFVLRRVEELAILFLALALATLVAAATFVVLPVEARFADFAPPGGWLGLVFSFADTINLDRNLLPSLHVAFAVLAALALAPKGGLTLRFVLGAWAIGVSASTVLLRQHHLLDVVAGVALAFTSWLFVVGIAVPRGWHRALAIEIFCIDNLVQFARRHRRYLVIGLTLLVPGVPRWRRRRLLRTGFCTLQAIDDLLDGDRHCDGEPLAPVDALLHQIAHRKFADDPLAIVAEAFVHDLEKCGGNVAVDQATALIDHMRVDRLRQRDFLLFDERALEAHHRRTFELSVDLMLLAGDCQLRSADVPELADALGWCSTLRDLAEDLDHGLVNLPREIVARIASPDARPNRLWAGAPATRDWLELGRRRTLVSLDVVAARLHALRDRSGHRVLSRFARSVRRYAERPITAGAED